MRLSEKDQTAFKNWILPKLDTISDAETDVLADYVTALVASDEPEANFRRNCIESLQDFLRDNTESFVNDVITALKDKTYLPKLPPPNPAPIQSIVGSANYDYEPHHSNAPLNAPRGPAAMRVPPAPHRLPGQPLTQGKNLDGSNHSKKRKVVERDNSQPRESQDPHYSHGASGGSRPLKQAARPGGRNPRAGDMHQNALFDMSRMPNFADLPAPPPGPIPFDMSNPMAFFAMAAAAFGANLPGMPPMPLSNAQVNGSSQNGPKQLCKSYHEQGFCVVGNLCPFRHSDAAVAVPAHEIPQYDPEQSHLAAQPHGMTKTHGLWNGRHHATKDGKPGASSQFEPSGDPSNNALVVEPIPQEHLNEDSIRSYFSEFGTILEVDLQIDKQLAIIKFSDASAVDRASQSPKPIFDNRFIKVYRYQPEDDYEEKLDREAIAARQAAAQKAFEERRRKEEEAVARAAEIERQIKEKNDEMHEIRRQIAELSGEPADEIAYDLHALHALYAEATELFDQHDPHDPSTRGRGGAFRGASRGRGFTRGRGASSYRGGYRGRGTPLRGHSAVMRLDNRPRRLAVTGIEIGSPREEALRQHLLNVSGCTAIEPHPEQADALILTFKERYQAEMFLDNSLSIPDVGMFHLAWVPNDAFGGLEPSTTTEEKDVGVEEEEEGDISDGEANIKAEEDDSGPAEDPEADMDVADDVDRWLPR